MLCALPTSVRSCRALNACRTLSLPHGVALTWQTLAKPRFPDTIYHVLLVWLLDASCSVANTTQPPALVQIITAQCTADLLCLDAAGSAVSGIEAFEQPSELLNCLRPQVAGV